MSGYWHDANHTTVGTAPAGSMIRPGDDLPVDDGKIALTFAGDEVTVIEGEKDYLIGLLELALDKVRATSPSDPIPGDLLPEDDYCEHGGLIDADGTVSCNKCDYCTKCEQVHETSDD